MTTGQPTVFLVDDDASVRTALSRLLRSAGHGVEVFASADDFLAREPFTGNGCIVLDIRMPGVNGVELHEELCEFEYSMPILYLTGHGDIQTGVQAIKNGAVDFLTKPVDDEKLLEAIRLALEKDQVDRAKHAEKVRIRQRLDTLTDREREVMTYVIAGRLNKQIADALGISEKTVKVHRGRVMEKLGVVSVAKLVRLAEAVGVQPAEVPEA